MCFLLYIASDASLPDIAWDELHPDLSTNALSDYEIPIGEKLIGRNRKYVSSEQGCGCGYRSLTFQNGTWPDSASSGSTKPAIKGIAIHNSLYRFVKTALDQRYDVSLYGCWDGDFSEPKAGDSAILAEIICDSSFYFRERMLYKIKC